MGLAVVRSASVTELSTHSRGQSDRPLLAERRSGRKDAMAITLIIAGVVAVFWRVVFTDAMFFRDDVFSYTYPHVQFIHEALRHGHLPYWNPYMNYGEPVLSKPNFLFFYPYTLFLALLPIDFAYAMYNVVHFALAGIGTYWLARRWRQSRAAAVFGAWAFSLSGPVLSLGNIYNHMACAVWIPWALLVADYAAESESLRPWILLSLIFTLQLLAGEPLTLIATFGLTFAYVAYRSGKIHQLLAAVNRRILGRFVAVGCVMVALAAVQFLTSLSLLRDSRRAQGLPYGEITSWSFHPLFLLETVLPDFFGNSLNSPSLWTVVLSCRNRPYLAVVFIGSIPLFFALAGWALGRDRRKHFVAGSALLLLLLSFGRLSPLFPLAYLLFPPLELLRFPVKLLIPAVLLISLLAGWGMDALRNADQWESRGRARMTLLLTAILGCVMLVWTISWIAPGWITAAAVWVLKRTNELFLSSPAGLNSAGAKQAAQYFLTMLRLHFPGLAGLILGSLILLSALGRENRLARRVVPVIAVLGLGQLIQVSSTANPTVPKTLYTYRPPVLARFEHSSEPYRFCYIFREPVSAKSAPETQSFLNFDSIPEAKGFSPAAQVAFRDRLLLARATMLIGVEGTTNMEFDGSAPPYFDEFWIYALRELRDPGQLDCLLGRTNVRYQIVRTRPATGAAREVAQIFNGSPEPSYLYENPCLAPRAYVAGRVFYSTNGRQTLARMSAPDFDEHKEVILATTPGAAPPVSRSGSETHAYVGGSADRVAILERQPNTVKLSAELFRPAYVVLLDRFDPNWHASVDGREVPVLRANELFRAVRAEAGKHEVRFYYRQQGLRVGLLISLATSAFLAMLYVIDPKARKAR